MFESLLDGLAEVLDCDRAALGEALGPLLEHAPDSADLDPAGLLGRIGGTERLVNAGQAVQTRNLAGFEELRRVEDVRIGVPTALAGRTAAVEVAAVCGSATMTAQCRLAEARTAVDDLPAVLRLVGTGRVSMAGLRKVITETAVLSEEMRPAVDRLLAAEACRRRLSPGQLGAAAARRVIELDPDAATNRCAAARRPPVGAAGRPSRRGGRDLRQRAGRGRAGGLRPVGRHRPRPS